MSMNSHFPPAAEKIVADYLEKLGACLQGMNAADRGEVLAEIRSHLYESFMADSEGDEIDRALRALKRLGARRPHPREALLLAAERDAGYRPRQTSAQCAQQEEPPHGGILSDRSGNNKCAMTDPRRHMLPLIDIPTIKAYNKEN